MTDRLESVDVCGTADAIRAGRRRAVDVVRASLQSIDDINDSLRAFVFVAGEDALIKAEEIDTHVREGTPVGPLAGIPFGVKDLEDCFGMATSFGSLLYKNAPSAVADAPHVARLRAAGAIPMGKTSASEFGMDSATYTKAWGATRNPWNLTRTPGGSSGGSAAAVSAGLVPFATGSDEGGSIRSPASFCGLVGLKPSMGRVPRPDAASDLNTLSVLTSTVRDTARLFDVMSGEHLADRMSIPSPARSFESTIESMEVRGLRCAWSDDLSYIPAEPGVIQIAKTAAFALAEEAHLEIDTIDVSLPNLSALWFTSFCSRATRWARYHRIWPDRHAELCDVTNFFLEFGAGLSNDQVGQAEAERTLVDAWSRDFFSQTDVLFTPAVACQPFPAEGPIPSIIAGRDASITGAEPFSPLANLTWIPSLSVPAGLDADGLPVGLLIHTRRHADALALRLGHILEQLRPWPPCAPYRSGHQGDPH